MNVSEAELRAQLVDGLVRQFDLDKYMTGTPASQLLNEGAEQIANGAKQAVIAKRLMNQLAEAAEVAPPVPEPEVAVDAPGAGSKPAKGSVDREIEKLQAMTPEERAAEKAKLEKYVLGDRARANRMAKKKEYDDQYKRVADWMDDDFAFRPPSPEKNPPTMSREEYEAKWGPADAEDPPVSAPLKAANNRVVRELDRDDYARQIIEWIDSQPDAVMTAAERQEIKKRVVKRAIENGEVRPSATPIPELPEGPSNLTDPKTVLEDEVRLAGEYAQQQAANDWAATQSRRETIGYDDMTLEDKKANGMLDGLEEEPKAPAQEPVNSIDFTLPQSVSKSKPRFGSAKLKFASDLDKAAYIIRNSAKKSKGEPAIIKALTDQGISVGQTRALGDDIKKRIQDGIEAETGSRRAPQGLDITIEVPASTLDAEGAEALVALPSAGYMEKLARGIEKLPVKENQRKEVLENTARNYARFTGTPIETARAEVAAAGVTFNPDKIKGMDSSQAFYDLRDGTRTPNVEAVANAYRAIYKKREKGIKVPASTIDAEGAEALRPTAEGNARAELADSVKAAMRPITFKTAPDRIDSAAKSLMSWTNVGSQPGMTHKQAMDYVRARQAIFDPDRVKGLDMDKARSDQSMGRTSPETQAVADAYRLAYGVKEKGSGRNYSIQMEVPEREQWSWLDRDPIYTRARRDRKELREDIEALIKRVSGDLKGVEIKEDVMKMVPGGVGWRRQGRDGSGVNGWYSHIEDVVVLADFKGKNANDLMSTAYHEAWHRVQFRS